MTPTSESTDEISLFIIQNFVVQMVFDREDFVVYS